MKNTMRYLMWRLARTGFLICKMFIALKASVMCVLSVVSSNGDD